MYTVDEKPDIQYSDIGGMDMQKQEIREAVELPLTHFELYKQIGIDPPRGVLMYGPPGCGKTMLAKAVAHHTTGTCFHCYLKFNFGNYYNINYLLTIAILICSELYEYFYFYESITYWYRRRRRR